MKFLFDLFPIILFVVTYVLTDDIYLATAVIIPATIVQVAYARLRYGKVDKMLWASLVLILVMGSLTLLLHDKRFIMWKPTLLYWVFATVLVLAPVLAKKNLIRTMFEKELSLPDPVWLNLNHAWAAFFAGMGCLNLYVAYNFSEAQWVQFKLFGGMGLMFVFIIAQGLFIAKYMVEKEPNK
jgi:intracellular septation protein